LRQGLSLPNNLLWPLSDESSASSDDPFEFESRARPWLPQKVPSYGASRTPKMPRKIQGSDLKLEVKFFRSRHFEFWDMDDREYIICPAQLHLQLKNPIAWSQVSTELTMPEIYVIDIVCDNDFVPSVLAHHDPDNTFSVKYEGSKVHSSSDSKKSSKKKKSAFKQTPVPSSMNPKSGVCVDFDWENLYANSNATAADMVESYSSDGRYLKGWFTNFWVPVPTRLFEKKESRSFALSTEVWFYRDQGGVESGNGKGGGGGGKRSKKKDDELDGVFGSQTVMTISHLCSEREML